MKVTAVLLLALATASAGTLPLNLKVIHPRDRIIVPSIEGRIVGGKPASEGQIPYQVGILFQLGNSGWACGGSIISNNYVLTAAHCTDGADSAKVFAGSIDLWGGEQHSVSKTNFKQHSHYNGYTLLNDISLIELPKSLDFGSKINKIGLPPLSGPYDTYEGRTVRASGWGVTSDQAPSQPTVLQFAFVKVIANEICENVYGSMIKPSHLCTAVTDGQATCYGDSGGPLAFDDASIGEIQIGVVSFGSSAGCASYPNGFSRITYFRDWIHANSGV